MTVAKAGRAVYQGTQERPRADESEQYVIAAGMESGEALEDAAEILTARDFLHPANGLIFDAELRILGRGLVPDALTVREELEGSKSIEDAGGSEYLAKLVEVRPAPSNIRYHANCVRDAATKRRLLEACAKIESESRNGRRAEEVCALAERLIFDVSVHRDTSRGSRIGELLDDAIAALDRQADEAIATPWMDLNDPLRGGLHRQELAFVAARPSIGKSAMLQQAAVHAARHDTPVLFVSLEMSSRMVVQRMLAATARLPIDRLGASVRRTEDEGAALQAALRALKVAPITIEENLHELGRLQSRVRKYVSRNPGALVMVDYVQLVEGTGENRTQQVGSVGRVLKRLATETDCAVLAAVQLNRQTSLRGGRPQLADLRESGDLEADADVVLLLERPEFGRLPSEKTPEIRGLAHVHIAKNRNGPTLIADLHFQEQTMTFSLRERYRHG